MADQGSAQEGQAVINPDDVVVEDPISSVQREEILRQRAIAAKNSQIVRDIITQDEDVAMEAAKIYRDLPEMIDGGKPGLIKVLRGVSGRVTPEQYAQRAQAKKEILGGEGQRLTQLNTVIQEKYPDLEQSLVENIALKLVETIGNSQDRSGLANRIGRSEISNVSVENRNKRAQLRRENSYIQAQMEKFEKDPEDYEKAINRKIASSSERSRKLRNTLFGNYNDEFFEAEVQTYISKLDPALIGDNTIVKKIKSFEEARKVMVEEGDDAESLARLSDDMKKTVREMIALAKLEGDSPTEHEVQEKVEKGMSAVAEDIKEKMKATERAPEEIAEEMKTLEDKITALENEKITVMYHHRRLGFGKNREEKRKILEKQAARKRDLETAIENAQAITPQKGEIPYMFEIFSDAILTDVDFSKDFDEIDWENVLERYDNETDEEYEKRKIDHRLRVRSLRYDNRARHPGKILQVRPKKHTVRDLDGNEIEVAVSRRTTRGTGPSLRDITTDTPEFLIMQEQLDSYYRILVKEKIITDQTGDGNPDNDARRKLTNPMRHPAVDEYNLMFQEYRVIRDRARMNTNRREAELYVNDAGELDEEGNVLTEFNRGRYSARHREFRASTIETVAGTLVGLGIRLNSLGRAGGVVRNTIVDPLQNRANKTKLEMARQFNQNDPNIIGHSLGIGDEDKINAAFDIMRAELGDLEQGQEDLRGRGENARRAGRNGMKDLTSEGASDDIHLAKAELKRQIDEINEKRQEYAKENGIHLPYVGETPEMREVRRQAMVIENEALAKAIRDGIPSEIASDPYKLIVAGLIEGNKLPGELQEKYDELKRRFEWAGAVGEKKIADDLDSYLNRIKDVLKDISQYNYAQDNLSAIQDFTNENGEVTDLAAAIDRYSKIYSVMNEAHKTLPGGEAAPLQSTSRAQVAEFALEKLEEIRKTISSLTQPLERNLENMNEILENEDIVPPLEFPNLIQGVKINMNRAIQRGVPVTSVLGFGSKLAQLLASINENPGSTTDEHKRALNSLVSLYNKKWGGNIDLIGDEKFVIREITPPPALTPSEPPPATP